MGCLHRKPLSTLRQFAAEADAAADYARALRGAQAGQQLHELIETHLKHALTLWFHIGQLAAVPTLIGGYRAAAAPASLDPRAMPGGTRFDPWCLTDPATVDQWRNDPKARRAIASLWAADPDPARTLTIHAQIQAALSAGAITTMAGMREGSYFYCCPWSPIFQVRREVTIDGKLLSPPHQFTFDVSAEELAETGTFVRRILLGPFTPTVEVDYCDPASGGHHDDWLCCRPPVAICDAGGGRGRLAWSGTLLSLVAEQRHHSGLRVVDVMTVNHPDAGIVGIE